MSSAKDRARPRPPHRRPLTPALLQLLGWIGFLGIGYLVRGPNPVSYGQYATLYARSVQGAVCTASAVLHGATASILQRISADIWTLPYSRGKVAACPYCPPCLAEG
jgi:hypothetical protein